MPPPRMVVTWNSLELAYRRVPGVSLFVTRLRVMLLGRSLTVTRWYMQEHVGLAQGFIQVWAA
jgi:hypothetical protein